MKNWTKLIVFFSILLFFLHSSAISAHVEDQSEFEYKEGSNKGPAHWGKLKKEWEACSNGAMQSPIDLSSQKVEIVPKFEELNRSYNLSDATVINRGHDIVLHWDGDAGSIQVNDVVYNLQQFHWHSPSEHFINGRRYDLELHMVHLSSDPKVKNKYAVVSQLYTIGHPDPFLSQLSEELRSLVDRKHEMKVGVMNPSDVKFGRSNYYRYIGSLTVPPCTEGVIWSVNTEILTVSKQQLELLRDAVHDYAEFNARPLQPLNGREIHLFHPSQ